MIIYKKYKQQIVIQLHENHRPNTVYLTGTGRQYKNIHYRIQNYSATLLVGRMTSPNKARKYKICSNVFFTHYYTTMLRFSRT